VKKGDIVLVPFPFTDLSGAKHRPALVLNNSDLDVTVTFITSQLVGQEVFDVPIEPSKENGIKKPSIIRLRKITTLDLSLVLGKIGSLSLTDLNRVNQGLKKLFALE
jgi:mRNA interferase MazF